jgi:hypothetical protein
MSQLNGHESGRARQVRGMTPAVPSLTEIIDQVLLVAKADRVTLRDVIEAVGDASFAPILLLPALAVATPLSGIPLFSSLMGTVIFLVSIQMVLSRQNLWLPRWVLRRNVEGQAVTRAFNYVKPAAAWLDERTDKRLRLIVRRPFIILPQLLCATSGAIMPLLEFVPFSSSAMGIGVALLALGMLSRDGLIVLVGLIPYSVVAWLIYIGAT